MRAILIGAGLAALASCASSGGTVGERPPQGYGSGGTYFGHWNRDADGAVDSEFRKFIKDKYDIVDAEKARADLESDGFSCKNGERREGRPGPTLECARVYRRADTVYDWSVEFWPTDSDPRARYQRTQFPDPLKADEEKPQQPRP